MIRFQGPIPISAPAIFRWTLATLALVAAPGSLLQAGEQEVLYIEDWDATPAIPNDTRGWGNVEGAATLEHNNETGHYARAQPVVILPNALSVPWQADPGEWISNEFVGNKDYQEIGVTGIHYLARHDEGPGSMFQVPSVQTSVMLVSSAEVPHPGQPGEMVLPRVWSVSDNRMHLGEGWTAFRFSLDSQSEQLPHGWNAYPDEPGTWAHVISDVDQIGVVFARYDVGIGGVLAFWNNALDNFTIERGGNEPVDVPIASNSSLALLAALLLILGLGALLSRNPAS